MDFKKPDIKNYIQKINPMMHFVPYHSIMGGKKDIKERREDIIIVGASVEERLLAGDKLT